MKTIIIIGICTLLLLTGCFVKCEECPSCPKVKCPKCQNQTKTVEIVKHINTTVYVCNTTNQNKSNISFVDSIPTAINNSYVLGLIKQIQRLERLNQELLELNSTDICDNLQDDLNNCELKLNQTKELLG